MFARLGVFLALALAAPAAHAQPAQPAPVAPATPPLVGATKLHEIAPAAGFVDDAIAFDGDRAAYVISDGGTKAELHVLALSTKQETLVDLSAITLQPQSLRFVGPNVLVTGAATTGTGQIAALVAPGEKFKAKPVLWKVTGQHVAIIDRDKKVRVAAHTATPTKDATKHTVSVFAVENGRQIGATKSLELDANGADKKLDFKVNHWSDGWTRAHGIKGGTWDKKEDQRSPDVEATFDLPTAKLVDKKPIKDLYEQRRRFQALAAANGALDFVRLNWDQSGLFVVRAGKLATLELDQPLNLYLRDSLQGAVVADGTWLALKVDKVHPDAVARKKADIEYLDIYKSTVDGKAIRKARVFAGTTRHRFGVAGSDKFWLLERNASVDRGGKSLAIYQLQ